MEDSAGLILVPLTMLMPCGFMFVYIAFILFVWAAAIAGLILWIFMLVDVVQRKSDEFPNKNENDRIVWILVITLTNWLGGVIYYFCIYRKYPRKK